ncbi:gliding motility lipoprotein GldH [Mongoliitalea daihaiensis]|uniref:gliding motility lipoprotein GldH n=1 Tax=Mongoliitalea daihaiensis TaxID=2782006 RepID=UPI001F25EB95|nr:gliding motility lipoprotein GldH [Mongoliitalea daihaiensis]UJP64624.1 gliding motility lipoprotein GldH [Mongoliitalea daihaiensis]
MVANKITLKFALAYILILGLSSCGSERLFEAYQGMPTLQWEELDTVRFELNPTTQNGEMLIAVKYTDAYDFRNLYVRYILKDSTAQVLENTLVNIPLFERISGKPLGKGFGDTFTKYDTLPLQVTTGITSVELIQYMRMESLNGIEAIGLKVVTPPLP